MAESSRQHPRIHVRPYVGRWVAIHPETHEIVADGASLREARRVAVQQGIERPLLMMVPESDGFFVGAAF